MSKANEPALRIHKVYLAIQEGPMQFPTVCGVTDASVEEESILLKKVTCEDCLAELEKVKA